MQRFHCWGFLTSLLWVARANREQGENCKLLLIYEPGIIFVKVGEKVTLSCMYNDCNIHQVQVHWCKVQSPRNCVVIPENTSNTVYSTTDTTTMKTRSITLMNVSSESGGQYQCQASSPSSLTPFALGHIVSVVVVDFAVKTSDSIVQVKQGDLVNLTCTITFPGDHLDKIVISWMKGNANCDGANSTKENETMLREKGKDRSVLSLSTMTFEKSGFYTCCVSAKGLNTLRERVLSIHLILVMSSNSIILSTFGPIVFCKFIVLVSLLVFFSNTFKQQELGTGGCQIGVKDTAPKLRTIPRNQGHLTRNRR